MYHELVIEDSTSAAVYTLSAAEYHYLFEDYKVYHNLNIRQIYWSDLELKTRVQKFEDQMLYCGCEDLELLCWKSKTLW